MSTRLVTQFSPALTPCRGLQRVAKAAVAHESIRKMNGKEAVLTYQIGLYPAWAMRD